MAILLSGYKWKEYNKYMAIMYWDTLKNSDILTDKWKENRNFLNIIFTSMAMILLERKIWFIFSL